VLKAVSSERHEEHVTDSSGGPREVALSLMLGQLEERLASIREGDYDALALFIVDAVLDGDEPTLETAQGGLQRLHSIHERIKKPTAQQMEDRGRLLALIDVAHLALDHVLPISVLEKLEPFDQTSRFLQAIMERGLSDADVVDRTDLLEDEVIRIGQLLAATGLARKRQIGRREFWEITPLGRDLEIVLREAGGLETLSDFHVDLRVPARELLHVSRTRIDQGARRVQTVLEGRILTQLVTATEDSLSEADVAERTDLSESTVKRGVATLRDRGLVATDDATVGSHLRVSKTPCAIGIEILPDEIVAVLTNVRVREDVIGVARRALAGTSVDDVIAVIADAVNELQHVATDRHPDRVVNDLGVELGGHINGRSGRVIFSPNMQWRDVALAEKLRDATGIERIVVENDANALAIYEQLFGDGIGIGWFAAIIMGDGIGAGLVLNRHLVTGATGAAGEFGHIIVDPDGPECRGNWPSTHRGCVESLASIPAILAEVSAVVGREIESLEEATKLALQDGDVQQVFVRAGNALGFGLAALLNITNIELIIISGPAELMELEGEAAHLFRSSLNGALKLTFSTVTNDAKGEPYWRSRKAQDGARGAAAAVVRDMLLDPLNW